MNVDRICEALHKLKELMTEYGGEITPSEWNQEIKKYTINRIGQYIDTKCAYWSYNILAFHTEKQRDTFLKEHEDIVKALLNIEL